MGATRDGGVSVDPTDDKPPCPWCRTDVLVAGLTGHPWDFRCHGCGEMFDHHE